VLVSAPWRPQPGPHTVKAVILPAAHRTILDGEASAAWYAQ